MRLAGKIDARMLVIETREHDLMFLPASSFSMRMAGRL